MKTNKNLYAYLLIISILFLAHAVYLNCVAEDAYISFRFAKNLASGHGLIWNIGERPIEGYTNFLWVLICAFVIKLKLNLPLFSQILGILASLLTILYTYRFSRKLLELDAVHSLIACFMLAASGPFATWAASGMETNLFGMFLLMGCYYYAGYWKGIYSRSLYPSFILLFAATLTRPEGFMIFCILLLLGLFMAWDFRRNAIRDLVLSALAYCLPFALYFIWRANYFGSLLPNTFYAKTGGGLHQYFRGFIYLAFFSLSFISPLIIPLAFYIWEKKDLGRQWSLSLSSFRLHLRVNIAMYVSIIISIIYSLYIIYVGGDYMAMYRFFVPLLPLMYIIFGALINELSLCAAGFPRKRKITWALVAFAAAATLFQSIPLESRFFQKPPFQHGTYQGVEKERWHTTRLTLIGKFFNGYKKNPGESIATSAIGAISYYADLKVLGFYGLTDKHIAHIKKLDFSSNRGLPGHDKEDFWYLFSKKPTYFMFARWLTKEPLEFPTYSVFAFGSAPNIEGISNPEKARDKLNEFIREHYKLAYVWMVDERNSEEGYFTFLELKKEYR